jgi:hypothetical protein
VAESPIQDIGFEPFLSGEFRIFGISTILKFWILEHLELFDSVIFFAFHLIVDLNLPLLCYQAPYHIQLRSRV